jgi:hypothetical protein
VDDQTTPRELIIEIDYKASLKQQDTEKILVSYEATHIAQFKIAGWGGFSDWSQVSADTFSPYFSTVHNIALSRAENTIAAMGMRGISLPPQTDFGNPPITIPESGVPEVTERSS